MPTPLPTVTPYGTKVNIPGYDTTYHIGGKEMSEQEYDEYIRSTQVSITEPTVPVEEPSSGIPRFAEQLGVGTVQMLGTIPGAVEALTHSDFLHNINNNIEEWTKEHTPEDFNLSDMTARGLGSTIPLYIPGFGILKSAAYAYKAASATAKALGMAKALGQAKAVAIVLESMSEAGATYREALADHGDADKASTSAAYTFVANLPVNALTESFGPLSKISRTGIAGAVEKIGKAAISGAIEEPVQDIISKVSQGKVPTKEELGTSALVGGIVSGIIGGGFHAIDSYTGKKSDFIDDKLDATRNEHKEETNKEVPLISVDTMDEVINKAEEEFIKSTTASTAVLPTDKYAPEPEGTMPQIEGGPILPSGKPLPETQQEIVLLTKEVKDGIRINLLEGKANAIDQIAQARQSDAEGAYRLYKDAVNRAIRENKHTGFAAIDAAVAEALGIPPMLEIELGNRIQESPISKRIAFLEATPMESRTPEIQKRIDDNKALLANTTIAKQLAEVKETKKATKEVRIEGEQNLKAKPVSKEKQSGTPAESAEPSKKGKKTFAATDKFSSTYVDGLIEDKDIYSLRRLQVIMEDEIDKLDGDLLDHKKDSPEYTAIKNRMDALQVQADEIKNARLKIAGSGEFIVDTMGLQKAYELLRNPDLLATQVMDNLKIIGYTIYDARMKVGDFVARMQDKLGSLYDGFKHHLITLFDIIKNQRGAWGSLPAAGKVRQEIRGRAFRDLGDKQWKMWIEDENVTLNQDVMTNYNGILTLDDPNAPGRPSIDIGQLINLEGTFTGYPELMNIQVTTIVFEDPAIMGSLIVDKGIIYINETITDQAEIIETIVHELQHAIQYIEGWSTGTSPKDIKNRIVLSKEHRDTKADMDKISINIYWEHVAERLSRDAAMRTGNFTFQEHSKKKAYGFEATNKESFVDIEQNEIIQVYDDAPYGVRESRLWLITKDTSPIVAAERLIKLDTMPLAKNDIRKDLIPAQRYEDGTIVTGESQMKIGFHSDMETTELGWVKRTFEHEDFIPESAFAPHEVPNIQDKLFGKEKVTMLDVVMNAKKVVDPTGQANTETFNDEKVDTQEKVRKALIRFEKTANKKGMALDNYLRDIGLSESAINELMNLRNALPKGASYIKRITKSQTELLHRLEQDKKIDLATIKAELGIKDIEGKKMRKVDSDKLINYIQVNKGIKIDQIIDIEVLLNNIENDIITADTINELKRTKAFIMQMFLSPDIVLSSTTTGKQIYNVMDKAIILIGKGRERTSGKTGFNIDAHEELIKIDSLSSKRIGMVLDGKAQYKLLSAEEKIVVDKMRSAFKYTLNEFVDKRSADANEAILVRQLAPSVKYEVSETVSIMKKKLHDIQKEYNISKGGMEALDLLRMERENYLPHLFDSQEIIKTAVLRLEKLIQVDPLSPKVIQLKNTIARLSGGDFVLQSEIPNELYFAHMEERTEQEGYKVDAGLAFHTYMNSWLRKMYLEPAVNVAKDLYVQLPASQKPYAKWFILEVAGRNKRTPGASYVSMAEWIRLIGFNAGSALTNATGILNTFADAGVHGIEGMRRAMTPEGRTEFYREGLGYEVRFKASPVEELHGKLEKLRKISGILFDQVELGNRMHAFHTGKAMGESIRLKGDELTSYAIDFMHKVQFRYGITGMARGMRGWPGVATQFSSFTVKQWELILGKWRREPEGLKKIVAYLMLSAGANTMLRFVGMDISNAAGIPLSYGDLLEAVTSATEGDWEKATKHWKLSAQGGTGILPREVIMTGPAVNLLMQIKDSHSPDRLGRIANELSPPLANKLVDFYYALKHGDSKNDEFPIYGYESKDPIKKALEGPSDLKYTLSLYGVILRTFGPRPSEETEIQRKEFARLLTSQEITSILNKYDKALSTGDTDKLTELFNLYPGIVYDRGTGALKRRAMDLTLTREQRSLFKRKSAQRAASLDAE